jgi:hypothetical protein
LESIRSGVHVGSFRRLELVLREWVDLMGDRSWWEEDGDAPWWYNERAILSLFAGAVWRSKGGWAFEEYSTSKKFLTARGRGTKAYSGRGDLHFWSNGADYAAEAKACHPSLSAGGTPLQTVRETLKEACDDVRRSPYRGSLPIGMVFGAPVIASGQSGQWAERLKGFLDDLVRLPWGVAVAWTFPRWGAKLRVTEQGIRYVYPGAILVMGNARNVR